MREKIVFELLDGKPDGLIKVTLLGWTVTIFTAPKGRHQELKQTDEAKRPGVYILAGSSEIETNKEMIYIGESDDLWERLDQHIGDPEKEFWQRTVIITSSDDSLTKAHVRYLESKLVNIAFERGQTSGRTDVVNGNIPKPAYLHPSDISLMDQKFLPGLEILLPIIGLRFTLPTLAEKVRTLQQSSGEEYDVSPIFYLKHKSIEAKLRQDGTDFFVLSGSQAVKAITTSLIDRHKLRREQLLGQGLLIDGKSADELIFTADVPFTSLSAAASLVSGTSLSGPSNWRLENGMSYNEWEASKNA
jgi:hypothetical protein